MGGIELILKTYDTFRVTIVVTDTITVKDVTAKKDMIRLSIVQDLERKFNCLRIMIRRMDFQGRIISQRKKRAKLFMRL